MSEPSLTDKTTSGVAWTTVQKWVIRVTGFFTIALLARLLSPQEFGIVAAATTVIPLLYLLSDLGFSVYIVQAERVDRRMLSTAFWFSTSAGVILSLLLVAVSPLIADLLNVPGLVDVLPALSVAVLFVSVASVPIAVLRRGMQFRRLAIQSAIAAFVAQIVAVSAALLGWGVWALVLQLIVSQAITSVLAWTAAKWLPRFEFSVTEFFQMARFGINVVGVEFVALLRLWAETAIITSTLGVTGLGYLNIAQRLVQVSQDLTISAITPVTTVAFAKIRESLPRLRGAYLRVIEVTYAAAVPFAALLAVGAPVIVPIVFGAGWSESVVPAQVYALASYMVVGAVVDKAFFFGTGRPGLWFVYATATDVVTVTMTFVMVQFGLDAVAWGFLGVAFVALIARIVIVSRLVKAGLVTVAAPFARATFVGLVAAAVAAGVAFVSAPLPPFVVAMLIGLAVAVCYLGLLKWCLPATYALLRELSSKALKRLRRRSRVAAPAIEPDQAVNRAEGEPASEPLQNGGS